MNWAANDLTRSIRTVLFHRSFPVDIRHNSKIFREKLAVWAERKISEDHIESTGDRRSRIPR